MGVTIFLPLFANTPSNQFVNGVHITSANPNIHSRIERDLGSGNVKQKGCNVLALNSIANVRVTRMELDNSGCQDQGMSQLLKGLDDSKDPADETSNDLFRAGLLDLKAWDVAVVHVSKTGPVEPKNIIFDDVKLTASTSFRKLYPGRPLLSVDNAAGGYPSVNVDGMSLNLINDTHNYRDLRDDDTDPVPLMPLHAIFWNFKVGVIFPFFDLIL